MIFSIVRVADQEIHKKSPTFLSGQNKKNRFCLYNIL